MADGLEAFPNDPQLLTAAAQFEEGMGDTRKAEIYWRKVVANSSQVKLSAQLTGVGAPSATATTASDALARMLAPKDAADVQPASVAPMSSQPESLQDAISSLPVIQHPASEATTTDSNEQASPWLVRKAPPSLHTQPIAYEPPQNSGSRWAVPVNDAPAPEAVELPQKQRSAHLTSAAGGGQAYLTNASFDPHPSTSTGDEFVPASALSSSSNPSAYGSHAVLLGPGQQAQTELEGLASRYSAWMGGGTTLGSRSGTPGFDQLTRLEADFETSAVLGENARLTVRALPVLLSAGASDGTSNYGYGASGAALIGQDQFQSGVGGEIQLATRAVDASVGFTPYSFYVSHILGSLMSPIF
jgi:Cellulose synthase operon protein C C-terminus (BCSC_C)